MMYTMRFLCISEDLFLAFETVLILTATEDSEVYCGTLGGCCSAPTIKFCTLSDMGFSEQGLTA